MRVGRLRERVTIYRDAGDGATNDYNERAESPEVVARDVPAEVLVLSGNELERARQLVADATTQVRIRYRSDVTAQNWFTWGDTRLDIESAIDPDGRRRELVCVCK